MSLALDTRQRDMLAFMGLPMQGWPVAKPIPAAAADTALLLDTMNPAVRSRRLGDFKNADKEEKISIKMPESGVKPAWAAPKNEVKTTTADSLSLWSLQGTAISSADAAQKLLLLLECDAGQTDFPLATDALALLHNILAAAQWPTQAVVLGAIPPASAQPHSAASAPPWLADIAQLAPTQQPALLLALGRNASRALLGEAAAPGSLSALRGQVFQVAGMAARVSYPLDYLLRKPEAKAGAWQDWLAAKWQWQEAQMGQETQASLSENANTPAV